MKARLEQLIAHSSDIVVATDSKGIVIYYNDGAEAILGYKPDEVLGSFVGNLEETKEMLELVKSGKVDPIPVQTRNLSEATKTLDDLREGNITGRVVLEP